MVLRVVLVLAALLAAGCGDPGGDTISGVLWRLRSIARADGSQAPLPAGTFTAEFRQRVHLEVTADCNRCVGSYSLAGSALTVSPIACTRAFCGSNPFDVLYVQMLQEATSAEREGDVLRLASPAGTLTFSR